MIEGSEFKSGKNFNRFQSIYLEHKRFRTNCFNLTINFIFVPFFTIALFRVLNLLSNNYLSFDFANFNPTWIFSIILVPFYIYVDFLIGLLTIAQYILIDFLIVKYDSKISFLKFGLDNQQFWIIVLILSLLLIILSHLFEKTELKKISTFTYITTPLYINLNKLYLLFGYRKIEIFFVEKYILSLNKVFNKEF
jgi:hypothetical protein